MQYHLPNVYAKCMLLGTSSGRWTTGAHFLVALWTMTPPLTEVLRDAILMMQALHGVGYLHINFSCIYSTGMTEELTGSSGETLEV